MAVLPVLAHAGEGATWQALVTTLCIGIMVVFLLVLVGRLTIERPDDALLPLAGVAVIAALAPAASEVLSDWLGWAMPAGVVLLVALALHTFGAVALHPPGVAAGAAVAAGAVASVALYQPIVDTWHPPAVFTAQRDDAAVSIVSPTEADTPTAGPVLVEVEVTGATLLPDGLPDGAAPPSDPEELAGLKVLVDGFPHEAQVREDCTIDDPCTTVSFEVLFETGSHSVTVELLTASGVTFEQVIIDTVTFEVAPAP